MLYLILIYRASYVAKANELIYNALTVKGIEIPFPQVDVNFKNTLKTGNAAPGVSSSGMVNPENTVSGNKDEK